MSLEEKVAQLFWVTVHGATADTPHRGNREAFGVDTPAEVVARHRPGGVVLFAWADNTQHPTQVAELVAGLQEAGDGRLGVAIDEEGGRVTRLGAPATAFPSALAVAAADDHDLALARWQAAGAELAALGITVDLAPMVDLANTANPVIGDRSFGADVEAVATHGALAVRGLAEAGVAAVAKHFPGHGATEVDSHLALPLIDRTRRELEPHLEVFGRLFALAPPAGVMPGHLLARALDPVRPATLSPAVLTELLRGELGFDGAVVTDSLSMAGIRGELTDPQVAVAALQAGADVLLLPPDLPGAVAAILAAVERGELTEQRIDDALRRADDLLPAAPEASVPRPSIAAAGVGRAAHVRVARAIAERAVEVDGAEHLPLGTAPSVVVGLRGSGATELAAALGRAGRATTLVELPWRDEGIARLAAAGQGPAATPMTISALPSPVHLAGAWSEATFVVVRRAPELPAALQDELLAPLLGGERQVVLVETGAAASERTSEGPVIRSYDASSVSMDAVAARLAGTTR